jgi:hypothetical protein
MLPVTAICTMPESSTGLGFQTHTGGSSEDEEAGAQGSNFGEQLGTPGGKP